MAELTQAWKAADGTLHKTEDEARKHEIVGLLRKYEKRGDGMSMGGP